MTGRIRFKLAGITGPMIRQELHRFGMLMFVTQRPVFAAGLTASSIFAAAGIGAVPQVSTRPLSARR